MTRGDVIRAEAHSRYKNAADNLDESRMLSAFVEGARWADQHPSIDTVKKIICYALKRTNIMLTEDLENGVEWKLLIKKAMKGEQ